MRVNIKARIPMHLYQEFHSLPLVLTIETAHPAVAASVTLLSMEGDNSGCIPRAGTQCYEGHSGHTHNGWDPHYHIWTVNQNPATGRCFWNRGTGASGATQFPPPGMNGCSAYPTWPKF